MLHIKQNIYNFRKIKWNIAVGRIYTVQGCIDIRLLTGIRGSVRFVSPQNYSEAVCMVGGFDKIHLTCQRNQSMFCFTFQCFIFNQPFTSNVYFMIRWLHINFNHKFLPKCWRKTRHSGPSSHRAVTIFFHLVQRSTPLLVWTAS